MDNEVTIYTDGGAIPNPGKGGYGVVLIYGEYKKEINGVYRKTTNNRMELMATIVGLQELKRPCKVTLYSDSRYVVDGIMEGWAKRWKSKGWMRNKKEKAINIDLWDKLLELCDYHQVTMKWVKGHSGNINNERCDVLANEAIESENLEIDAMYDNNKFLV